MSFSAAVAAATTISQHISQPFAADRPLLIAKIAHRTTRTIFFSLYFIPSDCLRSIVASIYGTTQLAVQAVHNRVARGFHFSSRPLAGDDNTTLGGRKWGPHSRHHRRSGTTGLGKACSVVSFGAHPTCWDCVIWRYKISVLS